MKQPTKQKAIRMLVQWRVCLTNCFWPPGKARMGTLLHEDTWLRRGCVVCYFSLESSSGWLCEAVRVLLARRHLSSSA